MKKLAILLPLALGFALAFTTEKTANPANPEIPADIKPLLEKHNCITCHALDKRLVGPAWVDVAAKGYNKKRIMALVGKPEPANWPGYPPMAAQPTVPKADLGKIAAWLVALK